MVMELIPTMRNTRGALVAATLLAGVALGGCGESGTAKEETPAKSADPKAAIAAAAAGLAEGNYAFTAKTPDTDTKGTVHLPSKSVSMVMGTKSAETKGTIELRLVQSDRWMKITMDLGNLGGSLGQIDTSDPQAAKFAQQMRQMTEMFSGKYWMHVDASKLKGDAAKQLGIDADGSDVTGAGALLGTVVTAQGGAPTITGTLDATKITEDRGMVSTTDIKAMGPAAAALPFTASLDDQGRLVKLEVDVPKAGDTAAGKWTIDLTGYGAQKAQEKPAGTIREMPETAYGMLNG
jgi:hypothetical protein